MLSMLPKCIKWNCPAYEGWGCFISTVVIGLAGILLIVGLGGPLYQNCDHNDCSTQRNYGLYCEDYCWSSQMGPGSGLVLILTFALFVVLLLPICWNRGRGRMQRRLFQDDYTYQIINVN